MKTMSLYKTRIYPFTWMFFISYLLLLLYFNYVDIYHKQFFSSGATIAVYNLARLFFIVCLMWLFYAVGDYFLRLMVGQVYHQPLNLESTLRGFFAGVGIWHIVLFFLGILALYNRILISVISIFVFVLSLPRFNQLVDYMRVKQSSISLPGLMLFIVPLIAFLLTKGLYPSGGHDYYTHYFQYYKKVIATNSILPNQVWYHFYYSKGAGLFFLSMLLTDPLGPQLATTAMILVGAVLIFSIIRQLTTWQLLPWIASSFYIGFLIYTPGPLQAMSQGGWGDLEKSHEPAAVLMLAIIWTTIGLTKSKGQRLWGITLLLSLSAITLINPAMSVFAGIYLGVVSLSFLLCKKKYEAYWTIVGTLASAVLFILLLFMNYLLTGIPLDQSLFTFWSIINFSKVNDWGILFEVLILHWTKTELITNQIPLSIDFFIKLLSCLRLDVWGPLLLLTFSLFGIGMFLPKQRHAILSRLDKISISLIAGFLLLTLLLSIFIGRDQPISYYRFTTFSYAPMLCLCLVFLAAVLRNGLVGSLVLPIGFVATWIIMLPTLNFSIENLKVMIQNGARFAGGRYSIADAYQNQEGWPARKPWGGIYPPAKKIWQQLPPHTRIWSMNAHSYCMLPDCEMESYMSYRFSPNAELVYYGDPYEAKKALKKENLNYFFFSSSLNLTDPLPLSPLFSPEYIGQHLGIAWTDGDNTLLTWKEDSNFPIEAKWISTYRAKIKSSVTVTSFPYESMRSVLKSAHKKPKLAQSDITWNKDK